MKRGRSPSESDDTSEEGDKDTSSKQRRSRKRDMSKSSSSTAMVSGNPPPSSKTEARDRAKAKGWKTFTFGGSKYYTSTGKQKSKRSYGSKKYYRRSGRYGRKPNGMYVQNMYGMGDYCIPGALGDVVGGLMGAAGKIIGVGDYKITKNSLVLGGDPPKIKNIMKGEGVLVQHREYLQDIISSGNSGASGSAFNLASYAIQPGLPTSFPWLSQIAANFQEYDIIGMVYEYKSLSSDAVATSNTSAALGDVIMATNYNSAAAVFANKQQMLESEFSSDAKPSKSFMHPIECAPQMTVLPHQYVRTGAVPSGQDQRLYDHGTFQIASIGCQATAATLGELWVSYEIIFYKPILGGLAAGFDIPTDKYQLVTPSSGAPFGSSRTLVPGSSLGTTVSGTTITLPANVLEGTYMIAWIIRSSNGTGTIVYPTVSVTSGSTILQIWTDGASVDATQRTDTNSGVASSTSMNQIIWVSVGPNAVLPPVITFATATGTLPGGTVRGDLVITEVNANITT